MITWQDVVRRLALAYQDGEPVWATRGWDGSELDGAEMQALYREAVGTENPPAPGRWEQCPCCLRWSVGVDLEPVSS